MFGPFVGAQAPYHEKVMASEQLAHALLPLEGKSAGVGRLVIKDTFVNTGIMHVLARVFPRVRKLTFRASREKSDFFYADTSADAASVLSETVSAFPELAQLLVFARVSVAAVVRGLEAAQQCNARKAKLEVLFSNVQSVEVVDKAWKQRLAELQVQEPDVKAFVRKKCYDE